MESKSDKSVMTVIGLALLVGGAGLAYWGYQMSHSFASNLSQAFTGALPDAVMYRYIGGPSAVLRGYSCW